ncbi:MAG: AAA family ATPase [candidate division WOR-3 bacterium]|nr:AAA family ATPase [candidate division WOR-3 bacterium]MDW8150002.1 AAA family ATPase [candidate division WOR-3 bacterium]
MNIQKFKQHLLEHIDADAYKIIYIETLEEDRVLEIIQEIATQKNSNLYTFDIARGLTSKEDRRLANLPPNSLLDPSFCIKWLEDNARGFIVFLNPHNLFETDLKFARHLKNLIKNVVNKQLFLKVIIISPVFSVPKEIQIDTLYLQIPIPTREEIEKIVESYLTEFDIHTTQALKDRLVNTLQGLKETEIHNAIKYAILDGRLDEADIEHVVSLKRQMIRKDSVLEFVELKSSEEQLGGMKKLKEWLNRKKYIFSNLERAKEFGVSIPKGILLFGMPGCGKSLSAKVIAYEFKLPLLRLDMGLVLGPYVGQSEENIRKAIRLAEALSPCVLWIDELEKVFSGVSSGSSSSDVMKRIFGTFLTWMQEKESPVFVIATSNDISEIPPEFLRKGRFDEIFFVDFPKKEEREEILKIHLKKRNKLEYLSLLSKYIDKMEDFSGADIEAVVVEFIEKVFIKQEILGEKADLEKELESILAEFKPFAKVMPNKVKEIREKTKEINAMVAN